MWEDSHPREVVVSVLTDSSVNIFGDHTGELTEKFEIWFNILENT
jgi:hypothetical protein